ncbi:hypothetical protein GCM10023238_18740 [Streptomyces heliomycini]
MFVVLDDVVDDDDVRVAQLGQGARLAQGAVPLPPGVRRGERLVEGEFLDGDPPPEQLVGGPPDHPHATASEPRLQTVTARYDTSVGPGGRVLGVPVGPHGPIMPHRMCRLRYGDSAKRRAAAPATGVRARATP